MIDPSPFRYHYFPNGTHPLAEPAYTREFEHRQRLEIEENIKKIKEETSRKKDTQK